ncbi:hypothetical protein [Streptomyces sp. NPDC004726]
MNLRMIGIYLVVVVAALLPLAAAAGPTDGLRWPDRWAPGGSSDGTPATARTGAPAGASAETLDGALDGALDGNPAGASGVSAAEAHGREKADENAVDTSGGQPGRKSHQTSRARHKAETSPDHGSEGTAVTTARCGPELASPEGVEAQTCVLANGHDTWARTYYRNATGAELSSVLTLMGPDRRTLRINCAGEVGDEPGVCETPRERSRRGAEYWAFAEFAAVGGRDGGPLLLRSGSNSVEPKGR